jgi:hypothetical protein
MSRSFGGTKLMGGAARGFDKDDAGWIPFLHPIMPPPIAWAYNEVRQSIRHYPQGPPPKAQVACSIRASRLTGFTPAALIELPL